MGKRKSLDYRKINPRRKLFIASSLIIICIILLFIRQEQGSGAMELKLSSLVREEDRVQLLKTGFLCNSDVKTDVCITTKRVRINSQSLNIYLSPTPEINRGVDDIKIIKPYPRKTDSVAMEKVQTLQIIQGTDSIMQPDCEHTHTVPVVVFSVGGYAGNTFHGFSETLVPLFLTTRHFRSQVQFLVTNYNSAWVRKHDRILKQLSSFEIVNADKNNNKGSVHCFPGGVFGLKCHGILRINSTRTPKGYNFDDFRQFLFETYDLKVNKLLVKPDKPIVVLLSRKGSRMLLNEDKVVNMMVELGFEVRIVTLSDMNNLETLSSLINSCHVLVGVHGADMTNEIYLPKGAVLVQVIPIGLNTSAIISYAEPAFNIGLQYLPYHIAVEESSLYESYSLDDPVFVDPSSIYAKGYSVAKEIYLQSQNVRINVTRFKDTMAHVFELLHKLS